MTGFPQAHSVSAAEGHTTHSFQLPSGTLLLAMVWKPDIRKTGPRCSMYCFRCSVQARFTCAVWWHLLSEGHPTQTFGIWSGFTFCLRRISPGFLPYVHRRCWVSLQFEFQCLGKTVLVLISLYHSYIFKPGSPLCHYPGGSSRRWLC